MLRNRLLILAGGCLLMASSALADDLGYVDCTAHPDATPVYAKARKSQEIVANVPCGEHFKVVLYGFIFSEIQTSDGKIGFVFSNVVTVDRSGGTLQARAASATTPSLSAASDTTKIPADPKSRSAKRTPAPVTSAGFDAATDPTVKMGGATSVPTPGATPAPVEPAVAAAVSATPGSPASPAPAAAQPPADVHGTPISVQPPAQPAASVTVPQATPAPAPTTLPDGATVLKQTTVDPTAQAAATPAGQEPTPNVTPAAPAIATPAAPVLTAPAAQADAAPASAISSPGDSAASAPASAAAAEPAPAPAEPEPPVVQSKKVKTESWEKPNYGARSVAMVELFGGFAFAQTNSGGTSTNLLGGVGSFAWNVKPWIQIVGDTSYNYQTVSGTKNVLYGNHYGARYYLRWRNRWNITPFAEGLVGGSRADTTVSGAGGYTASANCFSYKIGGGIDMRATKLFEIRVVDFDYYRTAFGTGVHQNNYWISTGIVLRLFAGKSL